MLAIQAITPPMVMVSDPEDLIQQVVLHLQIFGLIPAIHLDLALLVLGSM